MFNICVSASAVAAGGSIIVVYAVEVFMMQHVSTLVGYVNLKILKFLILIVARYVPVTDVATIAYGKDVSAVLRGGLSSGVD